MQTPSSRSTVALYAVALCLLLAPGPAAQDPKALADDLVRQIRTHQQPGGGYGDLATTCRVLDLLGRSPRRYNELDGPFARVPAERVAADRSPELDAWRVLALAGAVTPGLVAARDAARDRLAAGASALVDETTLLALATVPPPGSRALPATSGPSTPAIAVLLADDPSSVPPPPIGELGDWMRWARAARLRGLRPDVLPALPEVPAPGSASLAELLDRLELVILLNGLVKVPKAAAPAPAPRRGPGGTLDDALAQALGFLERHQVDGTFGLLAPGWEGPEPGVTALCLSAALQICEQTGLKRPDWIEQGLTWLESLQGPEGAIQTYGLPVYTTSVAIEALLDGGRGPDSPVVAKALAFLVDAQSDEGEGYAESADPHYGGIGYGNDERPDLSNTQMAVEAARRAGLTADHAFFSKALVFLERNQNLGESVARSWPRPGGGTLVSGTDGGGTYMPGNSPAGEDQTGDGVYVARSYGSMTYALTKSYLICGLPPDDQRVAAAVAWLVEHFTLETNPGFKDKAQAADGLYYYYVALARTLRRLDGTALRRSDGSLLAWRDELVPYLVAQQRTDGSWVNEASSRWYEGSPTLCTAFAALSLTAAAPRR